MLLGQKLKARREECNMTQGELAKNLCTQAMISKIERGSLNPSSSTLLKLSKKLNISVTYFYEDETVDPKLLELESIIRKHLNKAEYTSVDYLFKINHDVIINCVDTYFVAFFSWIDGILKYYINHETDNALEILEKILKTHNISKELEIDILTTLGIINYENANFKVAESFFQLALHESNEATSYRKKIKVIYNYSLTLESLNNYKKSLDIVLQGIDILLAKQSMYMLGYLYFHKAFLLRNLNDQETAKEAYESAIFIFKILNYDKMLTMTRIELKEMLNDAEI